MAKIKLYVVYLTIIIYNFNRHMIRTLACVSQALTKMVVSLASNL